MRYWNTLVQLTLEKHAYLVHHTTFIKIREIQYDDDHIATNTIADRLDRCSRRKFRLK